MSETGSGERPIIHIAFSAEDTHPNNKENCRRTFEDLTDSVELFKTRFEQRGLSPAEAVLVLANVDDPNGALLADATLPGHDWQAYRDRGETPYLRGIVAIEGLQAFLGTFDEEAAAKLHETTELSAVVINHGVADVFPVQP